MPKQHFASESAADKQDFNLALDAAGIEALHAEVEKWQARVPKLATALRARTDDLARARDEIRQLKRALDTSHDDERLDLSLKTRDELIAELDNKSKVLAEKVSSLSGEVHSLELALQESRQEGESWKIKWREVTSSLDQLSAANNQLRGQHAAEIEALCQEREAMRGEAERAEAEVKQQARLTDEVQALRKRNEHLSETTEMASIQMATLGDELTALAERSEKAEVAQRDLEAELDKAVSALETARSDLEQQQEKHKAAVAETEQHHEEALAQQQRLVADKVEALDKAENQQAEQARLLAAQEERARQAAVSHRADVVRINDELAAAKHEAEGVRALMSTLKVEFEQHKLMHEEKVAQMVATEDSERRAKQATIDALNVQLNEERVKSEQADELRAEVTRLESQLADQTAAHADVEQERDRLADKLADTSEALDGAKLSLEQKSQEAKRHESRLEELNDVIETHTIQTEALKQSLEEERARSEQADGLRSDLADLENRLVDQASVQAGIEGERDRLADKASGLARELNAATQALQQNMLEAERYESRIEKLAETLDARTALVQDLEEERSERLRSSANAQADTDRLQQELIAANQRAQTLQTHAAAIQKRLEDQRDFMEQLEKELSEKHTQFVEQQRRAAAECKLRGDLQKQIAESNSRHAAGHQRQADEVRAKLEAKVRDLEEQARVMQAEHIALKAESVDAAEVQALRKQVREFENRFRDRTRALNELQWRQDQEVADLSDDKMVLVLSQQLKDARAELERLQAKATTRQLDESDLTRISGVGEKIAKQLKALGIESIEQLADIDKNDLENKEHLLHDYRARAFRDGWIEQARKLIDN